jgi:hypothetical protein
MATPLTQFQKKRLERRKSSDIGNLLKQYQQQVGQITGEYETSFADYSKKRAETMAPYETATEQYRKEFAAYQESASAYKQKLSDYSALLEDVNKNPLESLGAPQTRAYGRGGKQILVNGSWTSTNTIPEGYAYENGVLYKNRSAGTFTEKAPTAPNAPVAPEVEEFDTKPFEEKKAAVETTFKREIGERKAAKFGAVSRKGTRTLLSGATPNA